MLEQHDPRDVGLNRLLSMEKNPNSFLSADTDARMPTDHELGAWADLTPDALLSNVPLVREQVKVTEAWKALAYARMVPNPSYDELAYRTAAATPCRGVIPVQTIARMLVERERDREPARIRRLRRNHDALRPRALDLPISEGRVRYEINATTLNFLVERRSDRGVKFEERWVVGRSHPPQMLLRGAVARDASPTLNQHFQIQLPHAAWVSLGTLIEVGKLLPRQRWEDRLLKQIEAGRLYLFISHRWRTPHNPDPDGREASLLAWQLIDHLCEAVLIASRRGLQAPRMYAPDLGQIIGLSGRDLAETMIVNLLRPQLTESEILTAAAEAVEIELHLARGVLHSAGADIGLGSLRQLLERCPVLNRLTEGICLWYDFASLPQVPRNTSEEAVFQSGLRELSPIQMMGNTVVLIDQPEHYLSRAWCTLEAIGANVSNQDLVLFHAEPRSTALGAEVEHYFVNMMNDRPYVVRRAILDTFLFKIQTPQQCFERLAIALTETADLINVFDLLRQVCHTPGAHIDNSSVVTGCLPLAPQGVSNVVIPVGPSRLELLEDADGNPRSLDWTEALTLIGSGTRPIFPAHVTMPNKSDRRRAHVIVIAGCEGDAVLIAGWASEHLAALESEIAASAVAMSWISDDLIPVGHMPWGKIEPVVVPADVWVIVAPTVLLRHGHLARRLLTAAAAAGLARIVVAVDVPERNVHRLAKSANEQSGEWLGSVPIERLDRRSIPGGIFGAALERAELLLFQHPVECPRPPLEDAAPAPEQLQVILINSAFKNDRKLMGQLCQTFPRTITELFKTWMMVPEELREPPEQARAYVDALFQIAQLMNELGFEDPLQTLHSSDGNPISRWYDMINSSQAAAAQGNYEVSNRELEAVLTEMKGSRGNAIDSLRPKVLGMISANHFHDGQIDQAREKSRQALEACREVGDEEGVSVYQQNLQLLDGALTEDDASIAQIYRAQGLSDQGRYEASNAILNSVALDVATVMTCKAHGLLGANYFWLGDRAAAEHHTQKAVSFAQHIPDPDALRVYVYNLTRVKEPADSARSPEI
ncbi:hypothetical protein [Bradyrhizobium sp. th.b2]|uniref:hypothetical protein n=1 Tax=Bradyrhizobium sp. th-b2 TaxID=172088 RepID=UPI0012EC2BE5|nr:hypothetical protein [Bradyrhizobium sp. th.b2]